MECRGFVFKLKTNSEPSEVAPYVQCWCWLLALMIHWFFYSIPGLPSLLESVGYFSNIYRTWKVLEYDVSHGKPRKFIVLLRFSRSRSKSQFLT